MPADAGAASHAMPSVSKVTTERRGKVLDNVGMTPLLGRDWAEILMRVAHLRAGSAPVPEARQAPTFRARSASAVSAPSAPKLRSVMASAPSTVMLRIV